jgi:alpha-tubulin suppressor-like RCC1 family protein
MGVQKRNLLGNFLHHRACAASSPAFLLMVFVSCIVALRCTPTQRDNRLGNSQFPTASPTPDQSPNQPKAGALAVTLVAEELTSSITAALVDGGLTPVQATAVGGEVKASGALAIDAGASFRLLDETSAVTIAAPTVAGAFVAQLDAPSAGLDEETRQKAIGIIVEATYKFTGQKDVDSSLRPALLGSIAGVIIEKTGEASLSADSAVAAIGLVADKTFSGWNEAGIRPENMADAAETISRKIGEGLGAAGLTGEQVPTALGKASEKAATALGRLGLADPILVLGSATEGFVTGISSSDRVSRNVKMASIAEVPKGVNTSAPAWLPSDKLAAAVDKVTASSVSAFVAKLGPTSEEQADQIPRLAEGSVAGLARAPVATDILSDSQLAAKPIQAIIERLEATVSDPTVRLRVVENALARSIAALSGSTRENVVGKAAPELVSKAIELATTNRSKLNVSETSDSQVTGFYDRLLQGAIEGVARLGAVNQTTAAQSSSAILSSSMDAAVVSLGRIYASQSSSISNTVLQSIPTRASQAAGERLAKVLSSDDLNGAFATVTSQYLVGVQSVVNKSMNVDMSDLTKKITAQSLASFSGAWNARPEEMQTAVTALNNRLGVMGSTVDSKVVAAVQGGSQEVVVSRVGRDNVPSCSNSVINENLVVCNKGSGAACPDAVMASSYKLTWQADSSAERCFLYRERIVDTSQSGIQCDASSEFVYGVGCRPKSKICQPGENFVYGIGCQATTYLCPVGQKFLAGRGCIEDQLTYSCGSGERLTVSQGGTSVCQPMVTTCAVGSQYSAGSKTCTATSNSAQCPPGTALSTSTSLCTASSTLTGAAGNTCSAGFYRALSGSCRPLGICDSPSSHYWDAASTSCKPSSSCVSPAVFLTRESIGLCQPPDLLATRCSAGQFWDARVNACKAEGLCPDGMTWDLTSKVCRALGSCPGGYVFDVKTNSCAVAVVQTCQDDAVKGRPNDPVFDPPTSIAGGIQLSWTGSADGFLLVRQSVASNLILKDREPYNVRGMIAPDGLVIFRGSGNSFTDYEAKDPNLNYYYKVFAANFPCAGPLYSSASPVSAKPINVTIGSVTAPSMPGELAAAYLPLTATSAAGVQVSWLRSTSVIGSVDVPVSGYVVLRSAPNTNPNSPVIPDLWRPLLGAAFENTAWSVVFVGDSDRFVDTRLNLASGYTYAVAAFVGTATGPKYSLATKASYVPLAPEGTLAFGGISLIGAVADRFVNASEKSRDDDLVGNLVASGQTNVGYKVTTLGTACDVNLSYDYAIPKLSAIGNTLISGSTYKVCIALSDANGATAHGSSPSFIADFDPPQLSLTSAYAISSKVAVTLSANVTGATKLGWSKASGNGNVIFSAPSNTSTLVSADNPGDYIVRVVAMDQAGNVSQVDTTFTWQVDGAASVGNIVLADVASDGWINATERGGPAFPLVKTPLSVAGATVAYKLVRQGMVCDGTLTYGAIPTSADLTTDGGYFICAKVTSPNGPSTFVTSAMVKLDTQVPTATAVGMSLAGAASQGFINSAGILDSNPVVTNPLVAGVILKGTVIKGVSNACPVTSGAYRPLGEITPALFQQGDDIYKICIAVADLAGNTTYSPAFTISVDTQPPTGVVATLSLNNGSSLLTANATGATQYTWSKLSGPGALSFGSPGGVSTSVVAETSGTYVVRLAASDASGNSQTSDKTVELTSSGASLAFYSIALAEVALDGWINAAEKTTASPTTLVASNLVASNYATVRYVLVQGATACSSATNYGDMPLFSALGADGTYAVCVKLTDSTGNIVYGRSASFKLDTLPPGIAGLISRVGVANDGFINAAESSDPNGVLQGPAESKVALVKGHGASCPPMNNAAYVAIGGIVPSSFSAGDGYYIICAQIADVAGNIITGPTSEITLDRNPPTISLAQTAVTTSTAVAVTANVQGADQYLWSKDSGPGTVIFSPYNNTLSTTVTASMAGTYIIAFMARDTAGNEAKSTVDLTWENPPAFVTPTIVLATEASDGWINAAEKNSQFSLLVSLEYQASISVAYSLQSSGMECASVSAGSFSATIPTSSNLGSNGSYKVCVKFVNLTSSVATYASSATFTVDTIAPSVTAGANQTAAVGSSVTVNASASGYSSVSWSKIAGPNGGALTFGSPSALSTSVTASLGGTYTLGLTAIDAAGNNSTSAKTITWGASSKLEIIGADSIAAADVCNLYEVKSKDSAGSNVNVPAPLTVNLMVSPSHEVFYADNDCKTPINPQNITVGGVSVSAFPIVIAANGSSAPFYVKATYAQNEMFNLKAQAAGYQEATRTVAAYSGTPIALRLDTPSVFTPSVCHPLSIGLMNAQGKPAVLSSGSLSVTLAQSGSVGFYSDAACTSTASGVNISANQAYATLFLKDSVNEDLRLVASGNVMKEGVLFVSVGRRVYAGGQHTCLVEISGQGRCWGSNVYGQLGNGTGSNVNSVPATSIVFDEGRTIRSLAMGLNFTCALLDSHEIKCWGDNSSGQLGRGIAPLTLPSTSSPGTSVAFANGRSARAITAGAQHVCAILDDQSLACWGLATFGQLGIGNPSTFTYKLSPVATNLGQGIKVKSVKAGAQHTCVILADDGVRCWGANSSGQLGYGDTTVRLIPSASSVSFGTSNAGQQLTAKRLGVGSKHSCAILSDSSLKCWGANEFGQLGLGSAASSLETTPKLASTGGSVPKEIALGSAHSCVVFDANGTVKCFGGNTSGQLGSGDTSGANTPSAVVSDQNSQVVSGIGVALGEQHSCAISSQGTVACWGNNANGQLGKGTSGAGDIMMAPFALSIP